MKPKYPFIKLQPCLCKFKDCIEDELNEEGYCRKHQSKQCKVKEE